METHVLDAKMIWLFRKMPVNAGCGVEKLFALFNLHPEDRCLRTMRGV